MKINKIKLIFKKAPFPAIITIISFILFILIYLFVTVRSIDPYYFKGLTFTIPFICFGIITYLTITGKLKIVASSVITIILIFILYFAMLFPFTFIAIDAATTITTDIDKYERVLRLKGYPGDSLIKHFPDRIPNNADNVVFSYNPAFMQGGETIVLELETDLDSIENYIDQFSQKAKWTGKSTDSEAGENGIFSGTFSILSYNELPEDFIIYLIDSKPYRPNNWNHGERTLVAISRERNTIIFFAEDW